MRLTVGLKIGGGFFLVTLMLLLAGGIGFNGALKLGGAVDYFANQAWTSGEGASELTSAIQKQANALSIIASGIDPISDTQSQEIAASKSSALAGIEALKSSSIATEEQIESLTLLYQEYESAQDALIQSHSGYARNRQAAFEDFVNFEAFMKVLEFYSNNIYNLPNIDQGDKFDLVTYFFKTKLAQQTRFYYMQRFLGGDDIPEMLNQLDRSLEELQEESEWLADLDLADVEIRSGDFQGNTYSDYLTEAIERHETTFDQLIQSYQAFLATLSEYNAVRQETLDGVTALVAFVTETISRDAGLAADTKQGVYTTTVAATIAGVIIAVVATFFCIASVVKPIVEIGKRMREISEGDGDLTQTLPVRSNDEIAYVGKSFNKFVQKIREIIGDSVGTSRQMNDAAQRLQSISEQTSQAATSQQDGSQQIATALNEMVMSFQEVARNAANAEVTTNQANESVQSSRVAVDGNRQAINLLSGEIEAAKSVIDQLAEESEAVAGILNVIQGIAEQTNLLALNAAIEAARAGEQGRGFSVVADEVRSLAQKTQTSTSEIREVIEDLKAKSSEAVTVITNSAEKADQSVEYASEVTRHLGKVSESVEMVFQMNTQIATAAEQQAAVADDINRNVTQINELSLQTSQDAESATSASREMLGLVNGMTNLLGQFKV